MVFMRHLDVLQFLDFPVVMPAAAKLFGKPCHNSPATFFGGPANWP
jgi:hypothetical protein